MKWTADQTRKTFLEFFREREHKVVPSSPLLPKGDPTLLFTNAGMNQFKPYFLGVVPPPFKRATSVQKCMRAGGKHNDLNNVGYTRRHHTFFEMLGNFSFGDYFKKEAIMWAWELVTEVYGLPKERLWITIYRDDDEAFYIWKDEVGVDPSRILRLGEKDNFWEMGAQGPCGPCSEIHYDLGKEMDPSQKDPSMEGERFLELWNLVFMQYNRKEDGSLEPLPSKNIDTGMGLERILAVLQGVDSNYHTDLFMPLIRETERITGVPYSKGPDGAPHRVIADHVRALSFSIADGIYPSNFGRGYVLRRILRRAHRFAQKIGVDDPILYRLVAVVAEIMGNAYPEVARKKTEIEFIIKTEEEKFLSNIASNLPRLKEALESSKEKGVLEGETLFTLYDTYGLPLDLIEDYASEYGLSLDYEGFESRMAEQRERARKIVEMEVQVPWEVLDENYRKSEFRGYEVLELETRIAKYRKRDGNKVDIVLSETPFYAESGGQIGDRGIIENGFKAEVIDTQKIGDDIIHVARLIEGEVKPGKVRARVDERMRRATMRAHTSTHLLHAALREVLGEHVRQEGSLVEPDRFRFDFSHFKPMSEEEREAVERIVNEKIRENLEVRVEWKTHREAVEEGAIALFTEKYGEKVRVISIGDFSKELCGGTHVGRTGDIGFFKIIKEEALQSGIRRIEALTGERAHKYAMELERKIKSLSARIGSPPEQLEQALGKTLAELENLRKERDRLRDLVADFHARAVSDRFKNVRNYRIFGEFFRNADTELLRKISDRLDPGEDYIVILGGSREGKANVFIKVSENLSTFFPAKELIREIGKEIGGGGGGSPTKAEGGGRHPDRLPDAISKLVEKIKEKLERTDE